MTLEQTVLAKLRAYDPNATANNVDHATLLRLISEALGEIFPGDVEVHLSEETNRG